MSELQKAVDKLVELTDQLEIDSKESIKSLREIAKTWEIDSSSIDEFETHINETIKQLKSVLYG